VRVPESFFRHHSLGNPSRSCAHHRPSNLLRILLDGGHSAVAGSLAGALRRAGRAEQADEILSTMKRAGYDVRESDPYASGQTVFALNRHGSSHRQPPAGAMGSTRDAVLEIFPPRRVACQGRRHISRTWTTFIRTTPITRCPSRDFASARN
jgi:hypothetical protein